MKVVGDLHVVCPFRAFDKHVSNMIYYKSLLKKSTRKHSVKENNIYRMYLEHGGALKIRSYKYSSVREY